MATRYISPAGDNSWTGQNPSNSPPGTGPKKNMSSILSISSNNDTIKCVGGIYNYENWNIAGKTGLLIQPYGTAAIIRGLNNQSQYWIINIDSSATGTIIDGMSDGGFLMDSGMATVSTTSPYWMSGMFIYANNATIKYFNIIGSSNYANDTVRMGFRPRDISGFLMEDCKVQYIHDDTGGTYDGQYRGWGIAFGEGGTAPIVRRCTFQYCHNNGLITGFGGTVTNQTNNALIEECTFDGSLQEDGIMIDQVYQAGYDRRVTGWEIKNCTVSNCSENGLDLKGTRNFKIHGNKIYGNKGSNDGNYSTAGWNRDGGVGGIACGDGFRWSDHEIYNNEIYNNFGGIYLASGFKIYNNTIVNNNTDYTGNDSTWTRTRKPDFCGIHGTDAPYEGGNFIDVVIENNIITGHRQGNIALKGANLTNCLINYNGYYQHPTEGTKFVEFIANYNWNYKTFAEWQTYLAGLSGLTGDDSNSFVADPLFVNAGTYDHHLQTTSPCVDAATSTGAPVTDKESKSRVDIATVSNTGGGTYPYFDIGAYELPSYTPPPSGGRSPATRSAGGARTGVASRPPR